MKVLQGKMEEMNVRVEFKTEILHQETKKGTLIIFIVNKITKIEPPQKMTIEERKDNSELITVKTENLPQEMKIGNSLTVHLETKIK